LVYTSMHVRNN